MMFDNVTLNIMPSIPRESHVVQGNRLTQSHGLIILFRSSSSVSLTLVNIMLAVLVTFENP